MPSSNASVAAFDAESDPLQPAANIVGNSADHSEAGDVSESAQTLGILKQLQVEMQSIHGRLDDLERGQDAPESGRATPVHAGSCSSSRWADHTDGLNVPMYTTPNFDDLDEEEKENQGTKLFAVSKRVKQMEKEVKQMKRAVRSRLRVTVNQSTKESKTRNLSSWISSKTV